MAPMKMCFGGFHIARYVVCRSTLRTAPYCCAFPFSTITAISRLAVLSKALEMTLPQPSEQDTVRSHLLRSPLNIVVCFQLLDLCKPASLSLRSKAGCAGKCLRGTQNHGEMSFCSYMQYLVASSNATKLAHQSAPPVARYLESTEAWTMVIENRNILGLLLIAGI